MPALMSARIDMIEELMYRCWARRHYLPLELREADWHPVILDEMALRDEELFEESALEEPMNRRLEWSFVPLVPTITHLVHPAQSEIREPHFLTSPGSEGSYYTDSIYAGGIF